MSDEAGEVSDRRSDAHPSDAHPLILFDGVCNLCNATIQSIIERDGAGRFRFAPLQSRSAYAGSFNEWAHQPDTVVAR